MRSLLVYHYLRSVNPAVSVTVVISWSDHLKGVQQLFSMSPLGAPFISNHMLTYRKHLISQVSFLAYSTFRHHLKPHPVSDRILSDFLITVYVLILYSLDFKVVFKTIFFNCNTTDTVYTPDSLNILRITWDTKYIFDCLTQ